MRNPLVRKMTYSAMLIAIAYLLTAFAQVAYPLGGYLNFGDAVIMFSSFLLGPFYGAFIGVIAGSLADLTLGGFAFIPFTIIAKGGEALLSGFLHKIFPQKIKWLSYVIGAIFMIATYFVSYLILFGVGGLVNSAFDLIQGSVAVILSISLEQIFKRIYKVNTPSQTN